MNIQDLLGFFAIALILRIIFQKTAKAFPIMLISVLAIFWLQPSTPIRYLDFWLPVLTIVLVVLVWLFTESIESRFKKSNLLAAGLILLVFLGIGITRFFSYSGIITATRPPSINQVLLLIGAFAGLFFLLGKFIKKPGVFLSILVFLILGLFVLVKYPPASELFSRGLRALNAQNTDLASALDIRWLGYSYVAFRLIAVLRDSQKRKRPAANLAEFISYVIFFPAYVAGPIDKFSRFMKDMNKPWTFSFDDLLKGGKRFSIGLLKKFVGADLLALIALNAVSAAQVNNVPSAWLLLYAYSFQIFLDFSGYTDIAIGIGNILGFDLPENFEKPYTKPNPTLFWNSWHITLTMWFRGYFFNPITRWLRQFKNLPVWFVILFTQIATMVLIGLWHGITLNFVFWGLWHGLGLFIQNRWSDWKKGRSSETENAGWQATLINGLNVFLNFNFISLGWIWFVLPDISQAVNYFGVLIGQ